jgi:hypothetical protein
LDPDSSRQRGRGAHRQILQAIRVGVKEFLLVFQDRIESVVDNDADVASTRNALV